MLFYCSEWCKVNEQPLRVFNFYTLYSSSFLSLSQGDAAKHVSVASHRNDEKPVREEVICLDVSSTSISEDDGKSDAPSSAPAERALKAGQRRTHTQMCRTSPYPYELINGQEWNEQIGTKIYIERF